jgi:Spy/CpxP family protein refolding chaperone
MKNLLLISLIGLLTACSSPVAPTLPAEDYSLVVFGETGAALEGTLGEQHRGHPTDGRTAGFARLPDSLKITPTQAAAIKALRDQFRQTHQEKLTVLRAVFERARLARRDGATRQEVLTILLDARPITESLREPTRQLHIAIFAVLTPAQRNWLITNRPRPPVTCMACGVCPDSGC